MRILIFTLLALFSALCYGQAADFNRAADNYLRSLQKSDTPAFFTGCKTQDGKAILVFGLGARQGMLIEMDKNDVVNVAPVTLKRGKIGLDIQETQGGIYTFTVMKNHAGDLSNQPFALVIPQRVQSILKLLPSHTCVDQPPQYP